MISNEGPPCNAKRLASAALALGAGLAIAEPVPDPAELPRIPPLSLADAQAAITLRPGFRVELAAHEPDVVDPVAIAFDTDGALFAVEMRGYPEKREEALGRVRRLTDIDGDGRYETSTVYAEGLQWPTGVACWKGGIFVSASPDIIYLKDHDGDGRADERRVVLTGFADGARRLNMQSLVNGLTWGIDGRIYGATAANGGTLRLPGRDDALPVRGSDFSFDPAAPDLDLRRESGTAQFGLAFDDAGRRYVCSNSRHAVAVMYSWPWNLLDGLPPAFADIPADGGAAEVFRTSGVEPWRVVRTRWRVQGRVGGPVEGGGRAAGYFTSASGLAIYRGDAFPDEFHGSLFVGDVGSNLVHRKLVEHLPGKVQPVARRPHDEERSEFLASSDNWFRPVQCANGPDGALYVVDMCRETIEHPWSIPESIKRHLDLYSGTDRGRIWRVLADGHHRKTAPSLSAMSTPELVGLLRSPNGWRRDTAARLLRERNDPAATPLLESLLHSEAGETARLHAFHLLHPRPAAAALADRSPLLRRHAVRHAETIDPASFAKLAADPDAGVRFEAALRANDPRQELPGGTLAALLNAAPDDPWILRTVTAAAVKRASLDELLRAGDLPLAVRILEAARLKSLPAEAQPLFDEARQAMRTRGVSPGERAAAAWLLGRDPGTTVAQLLEWIAGNDERFAAVAVEAILLRDPAGWERDVLSRWTRLLPSLREPLLERMRPATILTAVETEVLRPEEIGFRKREELRTHRDAAVRQRATACFGPAAKRTREEAAVHFRPALLLDGDARAGAPVFAERCAICHVERNGMNPAGPPLETLRNKGAPMLLENILAPDLEVASQYFLWKVRTNGGETHAGMIANESASELTLRLVDGSERRIVRTDIASLTNLNRSLMPAGLEAGLTPQQMADLLAFLVDGGVRADSP